MARVLQPMRTATGTNVLALAIAAASVLQRSEIWLAFGHGTMFRYTFAQVVTEASSGLPFLQAAPDCDTVSPFCGIGKKDSMGSMAINEVSNTSVHQIVASSRLNIRLRN